jgi:hypothetical protein
MPVQATKSFEAEIAEIKALFGDPVLSTENPEIYERILVKLFETFKPSDFMERRWLKQYADAVWDEIRSTRHKALFFTRKFQERLKHQAKRKLLLDQQKQKLIEAGKSTTELDRLYDLEDMVYGQVADVDAMLARVPDEHDHARVLELGMDYFETLDQWLERALKRQKEALEWFDRYRNGLGQRLRKAAAEIIDVECIMISTQPDKVADSTPVVPRDPPEDAHSIGPAEPTTAGSPPASSEGGQ